MTYLNSNTIVIKTEMELNIGREIVRVRMIKGMKQEALAARLGLSLSTFSKIEQSENNDDEKRSFRVM